MVVAAEAAAGAAAAGVVAASAVAAAAAAAGSVVSGSVAARAARSVVAADRGERAACVKSAELPVVVLRFDSQNRSG